MIFAFIRRQPKAPARTNENNKALKDLSMHTVQTCTRSVMANFNG